MASTEKAMLASVICCRFRRPSMWAAIQITCMGSMDGTHHEGIHRMTLTVLKGASRM